MGLTSSALLARFLNREDLLSQVSLIYFPHQTIRQLIHLGVVDDITERWPVPDHLRATMETVKHTHHAVPLRVYIKKKLIGIKNVMDVLDGALVEIHFELRHFEIAVKNLHSFNANIEQIMVLQQGESRPATVYKRQAAEEGLIRVNPTLAALQDEGSSGKLP